MSEEIKPMVKIKLESLNDLARFASSTTSMGHITYVVHYIENNKHYYGVFIVYRDYYRLYGIPMFYYIEREKPLEGTYILFKTDEAGEHIEISKGTKPGWVAIPIVNITEKPKILFDKE
ncbi:MAG: cren protein [Thermoprotei archaeon]|nr:MAG: cren protein [Thermoprotei archaeon]